MHIFLLGHRNIGKSTVINRTLELLKSRMDFMTGGFRTWRGGADDPHIYMQPVISGWEREKYRLASYHVHGHKIDCDPQVFDRVGVCLLNGSRDADLIIMDELGFLERKSYQFQQKVLSVLANSTPVIGVLRLGDILWHNQIKSDPRVNLVEVTSGNRDQLPEDLAALLTPFIRQS